jgi:hypothetical protein
LRQLALEIIQYIAEHAGDEQGLRASFLAQPAVVRLLGEWVHPTMPISTSSSAL